MFLMANTTGCILEVLRLFILRMFSILVTGEGRFYCEMMRKMGKKSSFTGLGGIIPEKKPKWKLFSDRVK